MIDIHKYDSIINKKYIKSNERKNMTIEQRSLQFAPFSALSGYDDEVRETERLTEKKIILSEEKQETLNRKLIEIDENIDDLISITVTYFTKDLKKEGGKYKEKTAKVKKVDKLQKKIIFMDNEKIDIEDIVEIEINNR